MENESESASRSAMKMDDGRYLMIFNSILSVIFVSEEFNSEFCFQPVNKTREII